jgi:sugar fermentation stimulation protein A
MRFPSPLQNGVLVKRYKRFLADVELASGELVTAHCTQPGSMMGLIEPGRPVWLSKSDNPKRKLKYSWELVEVDLGAGPVIVGVNTSLPNRLVAEAIEAGEISELTGYEGLKREVRYGENSRIDILLTAQDTPPCYVEIKNVTLMRDAGLAEFPDAVTTRGAKHFRELAAMVAQGYRAVTVFVAQRADADKFTVARDIDPAYGEAFDMAQAAGVEVVCYACAPSPKKIDIARQIPIVA